jgi:hypothetical protein
MTTSSIKPVTRETSAYVRDKGMRLVIATIHHGMLILRPKGLRKEETLDIAGLYDIGRACPRDARACREAQGAQDPPLITTTAKGAPKK